MKLLLSRGVLAAWRLVGVDDRGKDRHTDELEMRHTSCFSRKTKQVKALVKSTAWIPDSVIPCSHSRDAPLALDMNRDFSYRQR